MKPNFYYEKGRIEFTKGYIAKGRNLKSSIIKFESLYKKSPKGTEIVEIWNYEPRSNPVGSMIILHGLGTRNLKFLFWMASHLASAGINTSVLILPGNYTRTANNSVSGKDFFDTDIEKMFTFWENSIVDILSTIDFLKQEKIWMKNNLFFGYCLGGMFTVLINALTKEISKTLLMTVGGDIPKIFWESPVLKYARRNFKIGKGKEYYLNDKDKLYRVYKNDLEKVLKMKNIQELMESDVHPLIKIEPLAYAHFLDRNKFTMIDAIFDRALSISCRKDLWINLGKPKKKIIPTGHLSWLPFEYAIGKYILHLMGCLTPKRKRLLRERIALEEEILK